MDWYVSFMSAYCLFSDLIFVVRNTDGGINPPHFYHSHEEIEAACIAAGVAPPLRYQELEKTVSLGEFTQDFNE